jgi:hypothetical protein
LGALRYYIAYYRLHQRELKFPLKAKLLIFFLLSFYGFTDTGATTRLTENKDRSNQAFDSFAHSHFVKLASCLAYSIIITDIKRHSYIEELQVLLGWSLDRPTV